MFEDPVTVRCIDCRHFIKPGHQYEENSLGICMVMETWLNKFPGRRPRPEIYDRNYAKLGGKVCWPYADRYCQRFEQIATGEQLTEVME